MLAKILLNKPLAEGIFDLRLQMEPGLTPIPGCFLHIACGEAHVLRRPISLCDYDTPEGVARLVYAVKGDGTAWLARQKPGKSLDVLGPRGHGFDLPDVPTLLVGGGIGVPPMVFCESKLTKSHAILGFRSKDLAVLTGEFGSADICTDDGSLGEKTFPHLKLKELLATGKWQRVVACGPTVMLKAVAGVCIEADVPCQVSLEERMACGVGACLVCACAVHGTYGRVCADGPVFDAKGVEWDG